MLTDLNLERPIAFIDVETTGLDPYSDRIVELSIFKVHPDGREEHSSQRINPGIPIPASATAVHGISDSDVANQPIFKRYAKSIRDFLEDCDISGFNVVGFDLPCLEAEFERAGVEFSRHGRYLVDSQLIYHQREPRDLKSAYLKYCGREMANNHRSEDDARASAEVLGGQLDMYCDLPRSVPGLGELCCKNNEDCVDAEGKFVWVGGEAVCNFGRKHRGRTLREIAERDPDYLGWITRASFSAEVHWVAAKALRGEFPKR